MNKKTNPKLKYSTMKDKKIPPKIKNKTKMSAFVTCIQHIIRSSSYRKKGKK